MRGLFLRFLTLSTHNIMLGIMFISNLLTFFIYLCFPCGCTLLWQRILRKGPLIRNVLVFYDQSLTLYQWPFNWLIYIAGDGLRYRLGLRFLSCTEIGSRDSSSSLCNVNTFCIVQCSHQVWNLDPSLPESVSVNLNEPKRKQRMRPEPFSAFAASST